jgi:hypothetical protein
MSLSSSIAFAAVPDDFPKFVVAGHDDEMRAIRELY